MYQPARARTIFAAMTLLWLAGCAKASVGVTDSDGDADVDAKGDADRQSDGGAGADADGSADADDRDGDQQSDVDQHPDSASDSAPDADGDRRDGDPDVDEDMDSCPFPESTCQDGPEPGTRCDNATTVSRRDGSFSLEGQLISSGNNIDPSCAGDEIDRFYRIYLYEGETISLTLYQLLNGFNGVLALYGRTDACDEPACPTELACQNAYSELGMHERIVHRIETSGWYTIVVDCRLSPMPAYSSYVVDVEIDCDGDCGCGAD